MNNVTKFIIASLIAIIVFILAVFLIGNFYFSTNTIESSSEQVARISGEALPDDLLIAKSYGYDDRLVFTYVPRTPEVTIDLYADYELKKDGTTISSGNSRPYEAVSTNNPITFEIPRAPSSVYAFNISVEDDEGNLVHKSTVTIGAKNDILYE